MRRCFICLLIFILNISIPLEVKASELELTPPQYSISYEGVCDSVLIPYTGYYTLTLAGSCGGTYRGTNTGGDKLSKSILLHKGDLITFETHPKPSNFSIEGDCVIVSEGDESLLYLNNDLLAIAYGGAPSSGTIALSGINEVVLRDKTYQVHWHSGSNGTGCYTRPSYCGAKIWNDCDDPLPGGGYVFTGNNYYCDNGHGFGESNPGSSCPHFNGWQLGCGYQQGQIKDLVNPVNNSPYNPSSFTLTSNNNIGSGYFTIQLDPCNKLCLSDISCTKVSYNNYFYNVIVVDDTVVYCKHGNLN